MQEFFLIIGNNDNDHTWCNAYDYALLPLQKDASNLIKYIKDRYSLTDSEFDELLRDNGINEISPKEGELCGEKLDICWLVEKTDEISPSGLYVFVLRDGVSGGLLPKEGMPLNLMKYIEREASVNEKDLFDLLDEEGYLDDDGNPDFPTYASLCINEIDFSIFWAKCC